MFTLHMTDSEMNTLDSADLALAIAEAPTSVHPAMWPTSALEQLSTVVSAGGPIPTVRVSSAQARGAAKRYAYWGAARGEIRARKRDGRLTCVSLERASSDRRSESLAAGDADDIATTECRLLHQHLGLLDERAAIRVLRQLSA